MFNRGIDALLEALPSIEGLTVDELRRLLTEAWLETTDPRLGVVRESSGLADDLRRLATALEVHAILPQEVELATLQACGFVAAEAIMIAHELAPLAERDDRPWIFSSVRRFEQVEAGLLYLIAGYDANAALTVGDLGDPRSYPEGAERLVAEWALDRILSLLRLNPIPVQVGAPPVDPDADLRTSVRHELWRRIGTHVTAHLDWLTFATPENPEAGTALRTLAGQLEDRANGRSSPAAHPDLHHLLMLLATACDGTTGRALRTVPPPPDDDGRFVAFQRERATTRPLLWPAAQDYARLALPGPCRHAVVAVPTGSGKSSVAELATSQARCRGWVLYLGPTNALVGQIRRHTAHVFGASAVREFFGGAEYTQLAGEAITEVDDRQILVMTPEKCSLALRQNPEAFDRLALCILDEAHLLGDRSRGVIAELVLAEVMHRAPRARLLLMSALLANPDDLAAWVQDATKSLAIVVDVPWRPTRTLRAIAGVDRERGEAAAADARDRLLQRGEHRRNERFEAPAALLAGLQGAWRSDVAVDYSLVKTGIRFPLSVNREGKANTGGYCTPATMAIVQRLGERGDKVLAFLPRSKHDSFLAANRMSGFGAAHPLGETVEALLLLADLELGVQSALRAVLRKRIAVHTSALLREEQRASEVAFDTDVAIAMFATGTMAQGLNLPATAVVIGGTDIGYDDQANEQQKKDRARAQLLNAIGRAGRALVAPRSMAIVVPNKIVVLDSPQDAVRAVQRAEFLKDEDASSAIVSMLDGLITDAMTGNLTVEAMSRSEQLAFSFLSFASGNQADTSGVISKTWAVHRADARSYAGGIAGLVEAVGRDFITEAGVPTWISLSAHQSGLPLPETARLHSQLRTRLTTGAAPSTILQWARLLVELLKGLQPRQLRRILPEEPYGSSRLASIYKIGDAEREVGWVAYQRALEAWMQGKPLISVATEVHARPVNNNPGRGAQDPLPRVVTIVNNGFQFGLSLVAGAVVAIVVNGAEHEPDGPWNLSEESLRTLNLLPLAIRYGADTPEVLAWMRAGVRTRVAAHTLNHIQPPPEGQTDEALQRWAFGRLRELAEGVIPELTTREQGRIVEALETVRQAG